MAAVKAEPVEVALEQPENEWVLLPRPEQANNNVVKEEADDQPALRVLAPTNPLEWGEMRVVASGVNYQGNKYCKHYLPTNPGANTYHYVNKNDDGSTSVFFMNPDRSEYTCNLTTRRSRYTFPPTQGIIPRLEIVNHEADFWNESVLYCFSCNHLVPEVNVDPRPE